MAKAPWKRRVGRVTVYTRGKQFWIYYRNGKQIRRPVGSNREDAITLASRINAELAEGAPTSLSFRPVKANVLAKAWLEHHEHVRRSSLATVRRYRTAVQHLLDFVDKECAELRSDRVSDDTVETFVKYLRRIRISPNGHSNTSRRTMRDKGVVFVLGACRSMFSYAAEHRHLPPYAPNPFGKLQIDRMPIDDAKPIELMTAEQLQRLFDACDEFQRPIFFTLAYTGLRVGELTHLLIDRDIDFERGVLRVTSKPRIGWQVKTRSEREIPMLPDVERVIRAASAGRSAGPVFTRRRFAVGDSAPILAGYSLRELERESQVRSTDLADRRVTAKAARSVWRDAGGIRECRLRVEFMNITRRIGLAEFTCPKVLRHMFATALQAAGVDPLIRRELMGHTSLEMTSRYTHSAVETRRDQLARLVDGLGESWALCDREPKRQSERIADRIDSSPCIA